jgi:hypothetical protein
MVQLTDTLGKMLSFFNIPENSTAAAPLFCLPENRNPGDERPFSPTDIDRLNRFAEFITSIFRFGKHLQ